ncbi:MAG TPA: hemerythrin domain-containing protein [Rubrivivax sp.]|nr:hemerythrin domain-containing protein [Rubrivivax sp.]
MPSELLPGTPRPAAGFDAPLDMLAACHERLQRQCRTLRRLPPHVAAHGADAQAQEASTAVMRYFDRAAVDHHADEEEDLFPALLEAMAGSDAVCLRDLTTALTQQHRELHAQWQALRSVLARLAAGEPAALDAAQVEAFVDGNLQHMAREEAELLPMAARLIDDETLQRIGAAMRRRRGIAPGT